MPCASTSTVATEKGDCEQIDSSFDFIINRLIYGCWNLTIIKLSELQQVADNVNSGTELKSNQHCHPWQRLWKHRYLCSIIISF